MDNKSNTKGIVLAQIIEDVARKVFRSMSRDEQAVSMMACVVATYSAGTNSATLYMPPDYSTASIVSYVNHSGATLSPGDKVYILYKYGDISQGWIAHKAVSI